jgi:hypothetical protein
MSPIKTATIVVGTAMASLFAWYSSLNPNEQKEADDAASDLCRSLYEKAKDHLGNAPAGTVLGQRRMRVG